MNAQSTFEKALLDVTLEEYADVPAEQEIDVEFSPAFQQRMEQLSQKEQRRSWRLVNTRAKRILLIAILLILLLATTVAAVPALREGLIKFFTHDDGVAFTFSFDEEDIARAPKEIKEIRTLEFIPDGFERFNTMDAPNMHVETYMNEAGDSFSLVQTPIWDQTKKPDDPALKDARMNMTIDSENSTVEYTVTNGYEVMIVTDIHGEGAVYLWTDHEYIYTIVYTPSKAGNLLNWEVVEQMIGSIKLA